MRVSLLVSTLVVAVAVPTYGQMGGRGMMGGAMVRHHIVMHGGVPAEYVSKKNPLEASTGNLAAGKALFVQNCALCHGSGGAGDGTGGKTLNPPPGNLVGLNSMPIASDGFLYWTIAEGGAPVKSAMPSYKTVLGEGDLWKLILFVRTL
jgi:cytochrome c